MSLPDIDFKAIRLHHGSQEDAFEELCCQLASDEPLPSRVGFDRKGRGGDAGIECFGTHADGTETGWQVKFYWDMASMLSSLDSSLDKAVAKHPKMNRFIACFPIDLADSRRDDVVTALQKWNTWKKGRIDAAVLKGRTIEIERWDGHAIKQRLTAGNPMAAGRIAFWFDQELLTVAWFRQAFDRTRASLLERYSPETHIDLPIRRTILATTRDPFLFTELGEFGRAIEQKLSLAPSESGDTSARLAAQSAADKLAAAAAQSGEAIPIAKLREEANLAAGACLNWYRALPPSGLDDRPTAEARAVSNLLAVLRDIGGGLQLDYWDHADMRVLLVLGEAGTGKSHLLADACAHQINHHRPAIMVLGGKLPDAEPWGEILRDLDLPRHLQTKQFLGALNAAGEAAGVRALIAIDALNEKNGQSIWPERLAGLLHDVEQFPWISVVLSCRSTYEDLVIPASLDPTRLPRIEHHGFSLSDARRYLRERGISLAETPSQVEELQTPLFLRVCCDALKLGGEALLTGGLGGVTAIFQVYADAVTRRVNRELEINPQRKVVQRAITALAKEMADTGRSEVPFARANDLVAVVHSGDGTLKRDLLFQLQNEGLLAAEPAYTRDGQPDEVIRFTFERMSDHAIARDLLDRSVHDGDAATACVAGTPLLGALSDANSHIVGGLLEALAIQLPERYVVELPDFHGLPSSLLVQHAFEQSLLTRSIGSITARTWELIDNVGGDDLRYETLIALSSEPDHTYNVWHLDCELRGLTMPERDACWSIHVATNSRQASHLIDWAREADQRAIEPARAELAAVQLCWFLTVTNRSLRDTATKALVALLVDRPSLTHKIWKRFQDVDDAYVTERLLAAIYGAALQGRWDDSDLGAVAENIQASVFAGGAPPINILLRDHGRWLIRYADQRGVLPDDFNRASAEPTYTSPWPIEHVSDEMMATFTRTYGDSKRFRDEIVRSCIDGDFARYILDPVIVVWSPARRGTSPLPTAAEIRNAWFQRFRTKATQEMLDAYDVMVATITKMNADGLIYGEAKERVRAVKAAFREVVGDDIYEEWRAEAEHWRNEGMYQSVPRRDAAEFNLAWARRWVCKRAHDLGWSEELHGAFDREARGERHSHSVERIGKKYQWLALYELAARMGDNLAPLPNRQDGCEKPQRLRNIDPSMLRDSTEDDGWRQFDDACFWISPSPQLGMVSPAEAIAWLNSDQDILDGAENIEVSDLMTGRNWLVLKGLESWRGESEAVTREVWRRIGCFVVREADRDAALALLDGIQMTDSHSVPVANDGGYRMYLGEHPWAWRAEADEGGWMPDWRPDGTDWSTTKKVTVRPTTAEYNAEVNSYDGSITQNINLNLPARWLMQALGLRLSDGRSIQFMDDNNAVLFMDPSVSLTGRSAALVAREAFLDLLVRDGLAAIWAIAGEKNVYGKVHRDGFGGRHTFTKLFYSQGPNILALPRFDEFENPNAKQLAKFLAGAHDVTKVP